MTAFPYDIFISYSQKDRAAAERLQKAFEAHKLKVWRDERLADAAEASFIGTINDALERSAKTVVLWSRNSVGSAWVQAEAERARMAGKVVPLALEPLGALLPHIPTPFNILPTIDVSAETLDLAPVLRALGAVQIEGQPEGVLSLVTADVDISKLPETFATKLYGRDRERTALVSAWDSAQTRIFAFDAMGGAGKTALVYHFVQGLKASGWRGARSIFAWSFYSQGSNEDRQTSADDFFRAAYRHFGGEGAMPPRDPHQKGVDLAHLVQAQRALLILDGMEPLQYAARSQGGSATTAQVGGIKDPGVKALLNLLAGNNPGLCVVTTRIQLAELRGAHGVIFEPLDRLPLMAGIELLRDLGVEPRFPPDVPHSKGISPHPVPLPMGEGTPVQRSPLASPLPEGEGQGEGWNPKAANDGGRAYRLPQPEAFVSLVPAYSPPAAYTPPPADRRAGLPAQIAKDFIEAVEELKGHALALTLVGKSLAEDHRGDIRAIHDLPDLPHIHPSDPTRDAYRVMRGIEIALVRRIGEHAHGFDNPAETAAGRQLALLFFLGLFDRPADAALLPIVFPPAAAGYLQPDEADLRLAAKDPLPLQRRLEELAEQRATAVRDSQIQEIERERRAAEAERDEAIEAARRILVRLAFAGFAGMVPGGRRIVEALRELARRGLIAKFDESGPFDKACIDCHPLVRDYFGARLKELDGETFRAAHGRLYDHYRYAGLPDALRNPIAYALLADQCAFPDYGAKKTVDDLISGRMNEQTKANTPKPLVDATPDQLRKAATLIGGAEWDKALKAFLPGDEAGMNPLFSAIGHGCAAEREDETWSEVYWPRIARGGENFAAAKLGLYGQELAALASFFAAPFETPSPRLSASDRALALNLAGFGLRALGRLEDAAAPMRAAVNLHIAQEDWERASGESGNLSELLLTVGRIAGEDGAVAAAEASVAFADRSGDAFQRQSKRTTLADAAFQAGRPGRAEALFREAEALQKEMQPSLPRLYSLQGFHTCALLLARGRAAEAAARAAYALEQYKQAGQDWLLDIALDTLTEARAALAAIPPAAQAPKDCAARAGAALAALRRANSENHLPRGLLAHAEALWRRGDANAAAEPLREAETIAARGPMPLFLADAHLLRARIALSQQDFAEAAEQRAAAFGPIKKHGYGAAKPGLAVLDAEIACAVNAEGREAALAAAIAALRGEPYRDERTGITIDGGWWGLLPRLEALLPADRAELEALRAARDACNAERDAYLRSTLAGDVKGYDPDEDPIAAYLDAEGEEPSDDEPGDDEDPEPEEEDAPSAFPEVSDDLVLFIFAEAGLKDQLRDIMRQLNLRGEPGHLPFETKRAVVAALLEQSGGLPGGAPQAKALADAGKKRGGWWAFWRKH